MRTPTTTLATLLLLAAGPGLAQDPLAAVLARGDRAELARRLDRDPVGTLAALPWALPEAGPSAEAMAADEVRAAFGRARDPRVFVRAARRDRHPAVALGVARGAAAALEAGATAGQDQGATDLPDLMRELTTFEDSAEVRAAACAGLGHPPARGDTAEALVAALADDDAAVRAAAARAIERLAGKPLSRPAARAWARSLTRAAEDDAAWLARLGQGSTRERAARRAALETALARRPAETLERLARALEEREDAAGEEQAEEAATEEAEEVEGQVKPTRRERERAAAARASEQAITAAVAAVVTGARDLEPWLEAGAEAPGPVAAGIARGLGARLNREAPRAGQARWLARAAVAARAEAGEDEVQAVEAEAAVEAPEAPALPSTAAAQLELLAALAARPEAAVRAEALRVVPGLLDELDDAWLETLTAAVDDPAREVRDPAWSALRRITGQELAQTSVAWRRWWTRRAEAATDEEE